MTARIRDAGLIRRRGIGGVVPAATHFIRRGTTIRRGLPRGTGLVIYRLHYTCSAACSGQVEASGARVRDTRLLVMRIYGGSWCLGEFVSDMAAPCGSRDCLHKALPWGASSG